jgi:hypothetical protein
MHIQREYTVHLQSRDHKYIAEDTYRAEHRDVEQRIHRREADTHCKKGSRFSRPQTGCHFPNSPWPGIISLFPAWGNLVSDIPAEDGKISNLFLQCRAEEEIQEQSQAQALIPKEKTDDAHTEHFQGSIS